MNDKKPYKIAMGYTLAQLEEEVYAYIKEGYNTVGGISVIRYINSDDCYEYEYYQAMFREEKA